MAEKAFALKRGFRYGVCFQAGFTLLELIVSIAILAIVLVTVYSTLSMGSRTWEKGERDIEKVQRMRIVMDLLSREIKAAFPYKVTPSELDTHREYYAFEGGTDSLSFVSCVPLHGGSGRLSWLTFWVEEGEGLVVVERDALRTDIFKERETVDKDEMVLLDPGVTSIWFEYFRREQGESRDEAQEEGAWEETWNAEEEGVLPQAVKVTVTFTDETDGSGADDDRYTRELVIPLMIHTSVIKGAGGMAGGEPLMGGETGGGSDMARDRSSRSGSRTGTSSARSGGTSRRGGQRGGGATGGIFD